MKASAIGSLLMGVVLLSISGGCASNAGYAYADSGEAEYASSGGNYAGSDDRVMSESTIASAPASAPMRRRVVSRNDSSQGQQARRGEQAAAVQNEFEGQEIDGNLTQPDGGRQDTELAEVEEEPSRAQLLIYTGQVTLAIYDVRATQEEAVRLIEEMDGYISQRTSNQLVARIPVALFRTALDDLKELGDVLDLNWQAQDVSEEVRDLDIRLRNSLQLRHRLEALLDEAKTVEEALQIEQQLERVTLEVERIRGQLLSFEDRIAYSTITLTFRAKNMVEVPDADFLLPYRWIHELGLETLLRAPEVRR